MVTAEGKAGLVERAVEGLSVGSRQGRCRVQHLCRAHKRLGAEVWRAITEQTTVKGLTLSVQ